MTAWGKTGRVRTARFNESDYEVSVDGTYVGWFGARDRRWVAGLGFYIDAEGFPTDDRAVMWVLQHATGIAHIRDVWRAERPVVAKVYQKKRRGRLIEWRGDVLLSGGYILSHVGALWEFQHILDSADFSARAEYARQVTK